jgi:hypothetical protein
VVNVAALYLTPAEVEEHLKTSGKRGLVKLRKRMLNRLTVLDALESRQQPAIPATPTTLTTRLELYLKDKLHLRVQTTAANYTTVEATPTGHPTNAS